MLLNTTCKKKPYNTSDKDLPLTLVSLKNWILIRVSGSDSIKYLHNQFTCDIKNLNKNKYSFSAHCNNKGKMISNMYVLLDKDQEIIFIEPINIYKKQISIMEKYAKFSNVTIRPDHNTALIGVTGINAKQYLNMFFDILPNKTDTVVRYSDVILLYFHLPIERFLLIIHNKLLLTDLLNKSQPFSIQYDNYHQWVLLDIAAGYPYISDKTSEIFFPQSANLDILQGINFNKGCYLGQEMIAKIQYHKLNKQSLYQLSGNINWNKTHPCLKPGDYLELYINNNQSWKNIGTILQACPTNNNKIWIQAILNNKIEKYDKIHIRILKIYNNINLYININKIKINKYIY